MLICKTSYQPAIAALWFMISGSKKEGRNSFKALFYNQFCNLGLAIAANGCIMG